VEDAVLMSVLTDGCTVRISSPPFLIGSIHHQSVVCHCAFDILALGRRIVETLATQRRVAGQQLSVAESPCICQNLMPRIEPDEVEIVSMLMGARMEGSSKCEIAAFFECLVC